MTRDDLARWLQAEDEALLYAPDEAQPCSVSDVAGNLAIAIRATQTFGMNAELAKRAFEEFASALALCNPRIPRP